MGLVIFNANFPRVAPSPPHPLTVSPSYPLRVAFYQSSPQHLYGGQLDLLRYFEAVDRARIAPHVIAPGPGPFVERVRALDIDVTELPLPEELARTGGVLLESGALERVGQAAKLTPWSLRLARLLRHIKAEVLYANNRRAVLTVGRGQQNWPAYPCSGTSSKIWLAGAWIGSLFGWRRMRRAVRWMCNGRFSADIPATPPASATCPTASRSSDSQRSGQACGSSQTSPHPPCWWGWLAA